MSVKSYALTTRQRLMDFMGVSSLTSTQENVLDRVIDSVTEYIERYIGFRVKQTAYSNEEYSTDESPTLILKNFPIDSAETFTLARRNSSINENNWETIDSQYYHVDYNAGIIYGASGWRFSKTRNGYRVTYTAGYDFDNSATFLSDTEGGDLELATWMLATTMWNRRKGGAGITQESIGDYSVTYAKSIMENDELRAILDKYARSEPGGVQTPYVY